MRKLIRTVVALLAAVLMTGCISTNSSKPQYQYNAYVDGKRSNFLGTEEMWDIQMTMMDRNLYFTMQNNLAIWNPDSCPIIPVAHRGDFRQAENTGASIAHGLMNGYQDVEIDLMLTYQQYFMLTHDKYSGRALTRHDGQRVNIPGSNIQTIRTLRHRMPDGTLSKHSPPDIFEAIRVFKIFANPDQKLNIDLKNEMMHEDLAGLDEVVKRNLGNRYYYSSMDMNILYKMRNINPDVYLGFLQKPHNTSVNVLKQNLKRGLNKDSLYANYSSKRQLAEAIGTNKYQRSNRKNWATSNGIEEIYSILGSNSGLHVDIRNYVANPKIKKYAESRGMKVFTYTINSNGYHLQRLADMRRKKLMPHGAIVDMSPVKLCQTVLGGLPTAGKYKPTTELGRLIQNLPKDADFENYLEQPDYITQGMYITYWGDLKDLPGSQPVIVSDSTLEKAAALREDQGVTMGRAKKLTVELGQ